MIDPNRRMTIAWNYFPYFSDDEKLERILNWKIAQKSLGQPRVYATTCDESGIILAYFLLLFTVYVVIFVRFPVQMSQKSSCTWALNSKECYFKNGTSMTKIISWGIHQLNFEICLTQNRNPSYGGTKVGIFECFLITAVMITRLTFVQNYGKVHV